MGERVKYFVGVETWFDRINSFVHESSGGRIRVHHYIISAGLKEILDILASDEAATVSVPRTTGANSF